MTGLILSPTQFVCFIFVFQSAPSFDHDRLRKILAYYYDYNFLLEYVLSQILALGNSYLLV